ncbi:Fibroblast growth factor 8b [Orchesella cincta]|uniref:Fibroblast growth factor 8b n=1 Tax=Orchesella cincta TaxID=48709 RepID=A0A1D2MC72_ORCCI|nr:Fibroblast growth factor 8b [Orchesella cincta]
MKQKFICLVLFVIPAANGIPIVRSHEGGQWISAGVKPNLARQITQKVIRTSRLYNFCSDLHVQCGPLSSSAKKTSPEGELIFETLMKQGQLRTRIKCLYTNKYICFNKEGHLVERKKPKGRCDFIEEQVGGHFKYRSVEASSWVLGFSKEGQPLNATQYFDSQFDSCFNFLKLDSLLQSINLWNWNIV